MEGDHFLIKGLEVLCILGVYNREREKPQPVRVDLGFPAVIERKGGIPYEPLVDYAKLATVVKTHVKKSKCFLMEELAEEIAHLCLSRFPLEWVEVRLSKPFAISGTDNVSLEIKREQTNRETQSE